MSRDETAYRKAYRENEVNANRHISIAYLFTAGLMLIIWIAYLAGSPHINAIVRVMELFSFAMPVCLVILLTAFILARTKLSRRAGFKYYMVFSLVAVVALLNIMVPKHAIIGWTLAIVLANHFYNRRLSIIVFAVSLVLMLGCIYLGMLFGEFDSNLLTGENNTTLKIITSADYPGMTWPDNVDGRIAFLQHLMDHGYNRYITAFTYYYLPRASILTILFFVTMTLNRRTYRLFVSEFRITEEQQKGKAELEVAAQIQQQALPDGFYQDEAVEVQAELNAAREVGGDFYDCFPIDEDHFAFFIGDVSGKGVPAAMFMMKSITCFQNRVKEGGTPAEIMKDVNAALCKGNSKGMFTTAFLGILDTKTGVLTFANAGHNPPIVGQHQHYVYLPCMSGFILGTMEPCFCVDQKIRLKPGDSITLYTDGLTEAMNLARETFGETRLLKIFNEHDYTSSLELHHTLKDKISEFVGLAEQSDDRTYLTLTFHGDHYNFEEETFPAKKEKVADMLAFIKHFAAKYEIEERSAKELLIVGDELLSNVVKYAYADDKGTVFLRLLYNYDKKELTFTIIDTGVPFNPLENQAEPLGGIEGRKAGGLGILMVKELVAKVSYDRINGKNILVLKKKLEE